MDTVPAKTILTRNKDTSWFGSDYNMNLYRAAPMGAFTATAGAHATMWRALTGCA